MSETWLVDNSKLWEMENDLRHRDAIKMISLTRRFKDAKNPGGGVAILFKRPGLSDEFLAEELSEFFSRITDAFEPLDMKKSLRRSPLPFSPSNHMRSLT